MGKPKPPESPDYIGAAKAQGDANIESARANMGFGTPNMYTPYGQRTLSYTFNPMTGMNDQPEITETVHPTAQAAIEEGIGAQYQMGATANEQSRNIRNLLNTPFNFSGTPQAALDESGVARAPINAGTTAQQAIMQRLQPQMARNRTSLETQLVNQGLRPGGEAYDNAVRLLGEQENDLMSQAALHGIGADMSANQQGFGQALTRGQFGNTALQQRLALESQLRDQPINEIAALLSGSQVQNPQFSPYQGAVAAPSPIFAGTQAKGQWDMDQYEQQVAQRNALLGGLFSLGTAGVGGLFGLGGGR